MQYSATSLWWIFAGLIIAAELLTGTIYLFMVALGLAAGGLAAWAGLALPGQVVIASLVGGVGTGIWHWQRYSHPRSAPAASNPDVNLDIGARVMVSAWDEQGYGQTHYRGSNWKVHLQEGAFTQLGEHQVVEVQGICLVVVPVK